MKVVIGGSFRFYDKMKELKRELEEAGIECSIPIHFASFEDREKIEEFKQAVRSGEIKLNRKDYEEIGKVESLFFTWIDECDVFLVCNGNGYIGVNTAIDIGYALGRKKEVILLYPPEDAGIQGLVEVKLLKVISKDKIINYLKGKA